jgi:hypothetical protein
LAQIYLERTRHIYPTDNSLLEKQLLKVENFTIQNQMRINESKSKVMLFNKSRKFDFPPEFAFRNGENLEGVEETRLLGLVCKYKISICQGHLKNVAVEEDESAEARSSHHCFLLLEGNKSFG